MSTADIKPALKKLLPVLLKAKEDQLNEADTVVRIIKVLEDVLGYDALSEITHEQQIKAKYVDLAIRVDGRIRLLIEAKAAGNALRDRYIEQAERYASEGNYQWVLLTNGIEWSLYHLTFDEGIDYSRAWHINLEENSIDEACDKLLLLHRSSIKSNALDPYWEKLQSISVESIGRALFDEAVIDLIRREIRKKTGIRPDEEILAKALHDMLTDKVREVIGPLKIHRNRKQRGKSGTRSIAAGGEEPQIMSAELPIEELP